MGKRHKFLFYLVMIMQLFIMQSGYSQIIPDSNILKGTIKGKVIDSETKIPLIGTNIIIIDTKLGASTDSNGNFTILNVPYGSYTLKFSYIGYEPVSKTDVIVKSKRITYLDVELKVTAIGMEQIVITEGYFSETEGQPNSVINFSSEEIRRSAGSAGDVSRIISGLPSIAKINDQTNSLIVRGGSPVENAFFIDNIEIPNINHYPTQGASGGPIGLINVDFIKDVNFYSGGFSAAYGDKLSSVMDLTFREGNREELDGQLDFNFAGLGVIGEGPVSKGKGSWLFSARRSFLDLLVNAIGTGVAPRYSDYQGKLVYDINTRNKITFLGILGVDYIGTTKKQSEDNGEIVYGNTDDIESSFGINWRSLWCENGYSNTSISHISAKDVAEYFETRTDKRLIKNNSLEQSFQMRNVNYYRFDESNRVEFGIDAKYIINEYDNFTSEYTDALGNPTPESKINDKINGQKIGTYVNYIWMPFNKLTTTTGVRFDYFSYNKNSHISPRFSFSYKINEKTSINGSTGIFYQNLPLIILSQNKENKKLKDPVAYHYVLGIGHLLTENTKLTFEVYDKEYNNFPLDPTSPSLFILDELFYRYGFFFNHEELVNDGKAYSRGVELMIQKKLAKDFYGLISGAYFRTRYKGYDGVWKDRVFDNRYLFSIEGGYKPNSKWEFSMRWIYAGGPPFTPFDVDASQSINRAVFDPNRINEARYADYHSLNIRFDRRFYFNKTNLIFYFSIWNAYNRKNIASYYWNEIKNKQDIIYQWSLLPIFGLEYEF